LRFGLGRVELLWQGLGERLSLWGLGAGSWELGLGLRAGWQLKLGLWDGTGLRAEAESVGELGVEIGFGGGLGAEVGSVGELGAGIGFGGGLGAEVGSVGGPGAEIGSVGAGADDTCDHDL
jgi:hypothetical protein